MKTKLLFLSFLLFYFLSTSQNVNIPDPLFKTILVNNSSINLNMDLEIQVSEAAVYNGAISINGIPAISDLTGIEAFTLATEIDISGTSVVNANFSFSNNFQTIYAFPSNALSLIDVSGCSNLEQLIVSDCNIASIDVSNNPLLERFQVISTNITSVDVSNNPLIFDFNISNSSGVTSLDLSNNGALMFFNVTNNDLTVLNIANGNNAAIVNFFADANSNLTCIQIDSGFTPPFNWQKDVTASYSGNCATLSTIDFSKSEVLLYPNPVASVLNIEMISVIKQVTVYSILGAEVLKTTSKTIDASALKQGVYLIKIEDEAGAVVIKRFIKQ